MDSKLRGIAVFFSILMVLVVGGVVVLANWKSVQNLLYPQPVSVTEPETQEETAEVGLSDFMKDETFFDAEVPKLGAAGARESELRRSLSLIANSIQKDMRIQIVDGYGELVKGKGFYVTLKEIGEYKDVDQDGIIYIGDLKPGEYQVTLNEMPGYTVSSDPIRVKVKENLEYTVMNDIELLIKSEDQVDVESEDTEVNEAVEDADDTEIKVSKKSDGKARFGIDVSKYNKEINWAAVKEDGVDFAIIRCGYRGSKSGVLVEDPYFEENISGANANGVSAGIYFFTQATNEIEAVEEASMVLTLCREYNVEYPIFIDTEGAGGNGRADNLTKEQRTAVCAAFCETIESAGYITGVYASRHWLNNNLDVKQLDNHVIWLAEYRAVPEYAGKYEMWQYTSSGTVNGIEGRVDLNVSYLGY